MITQIRTFSLNLGTSNKNFKATKYSLERSFQKEQESQKKNFFFKFFRNVLIGRNTVCFIKRQKLRGLPIDAILILWEKTKCYLFHFYCCVLPFDFSKYALLWNLIK